MNNASQNTSLRSSAIATSAGKVFLGLALAVGTAAGFKAQGQAPSGTISSSGSGPYNYSLTFSNASGSLSPVGSVWYSWIPGSFYLPGDPTAGTAVAPTGWTATIVANSIQFAATNSAYDIAAGSSLSGFGYEATFTPAQLAAAPNSGVSVAYAGGIESGPGFTFTVEPATVPEPSTLALLLPGTIALLMVRRSSRSDRH